MNYLLGIDGGGTRTTAWLADEHGRILARAEAGPSNPVKAGFEPAQHEILRAAREALRHARAGLRSALTLQAVVVGLAGVDRPQAHRRFLKWLKRNIPAWHHLLISDAAIALAAANGDQAGIVVVAGTGSIAFGRDRQGRTHRSGGWGSLFDDAGSGYDIGRKAIAAALRGLDGRGPRTRLARSLPGALGIARLTDVVLKPPSPPGMAALFPTVLRAARSGDRIAREILRDAGCDLAELTFALARRLRWSRRKFILVCSGGVFRSSLLIRNAFAAAVRRKCPRAKIVLLRRPAVLGAIVIARKLAKSRRGWV